MRNLFFSLFILFVPLFLSSQIITFETSVKVDGQTVATLTEDANRVILVDFLGNLVESVNVSAPELGFDLEGDFEYVEVIGGDLSQEYGYVTFPNGVNSMFLTRESGIKYYNNSALPSGSIWIATDITDPTVYDFKIVAIPK